MAADQIACQIQSYSQMHSWEPVQNLRKKNPMQCIMIFEDNELLLNVQVNQARGYKPFSIFNSAEYEIYPAHKC